MLVYKISRRLSSIWVLPQKGKSFCPISGMKAFLFPEYSSSDVKAMLKYLDNNKLIKIVQRKVFFLL